jgi:hypothetical protein
VREKRRKHRETSHVGQKNGSIQIFNTREITFDVIKTLHSPQPKRFRKSREVAKPRARFCKRPPTREYTGSKRRNWGVFPLPWSGRGSVLWTENPSTLLRDNAVVCTLWTTTRRFVTPSIIYMI